MTDYCEFLGEGNRCSLFSELRGKSMCVNYAYCRQRCAPQGTAAEKKAKLEHHLATRKLITLTIKNEPELVRYFQECRKICRACGRCPITRIPRRAGHYESGFYCREDQWPEPPFDFLRKKRDLCHSLLRSVS